MLLSITEAAKFLGVHPQSLRNWDHQGKLKPFRTPGNQRKYSTEQLEGFLEWMKQNSV